MCAQHMHEYVHVVAEGWGSPHLLLGLLEALRHEVNVLEGGDETLLEAGRLRVERLHAGFV